jgi:O-antigen/teichoic acid export membrane protein
MPLGLILAPLGEPLAIVVFGERWSVAGQVTAAICLFIPAQTVAAEIGEGFKAAGIPAKRTRVNAIAVVTGGLTMLALTPLIGLYGVGVGISVDAIAGASVAIALARGAMEIPVRSFLVAIAPAAGAALVMVAALFPLENLVVHAADHGTVLGLLLLAVQGLIGLAIYLAVLRVLAPGLGSELLGLVRTARGRPDGGPGAEGDEELLEDEGEPMLPG